MIEVPRSLSAYARQAARDDVRRRRKNLALSLLLSALIHSSIAAALLLSGPFAADEKTYNVTRITGIEITPDQKSRIIWYSLKRERLPTITPANPDRAPEPRTRMKAPERIVTQGANPTREFVWVPTPEVKPQQPTRTPNLIAVATRVAPPPPPERKAFTPPPAPQRTPSADPKLFNAPEVAAAASLDNARALKLAQGQMRVAAPSPKAFVPPAERTPVLPVPNGSLPSAAPELASAVSLEANRSLKLAQGELRVAAPPKKSFIPPAARTGAPGGTGSAPTSVEPPPQVAAAGPVPSDVVAAAINLDAAANVPKPPPASRPGAISAGRGTPFADGQGLPSRPGGLPVPGLSVDGSGTLPAPAVAREQSASASGRTQPVAGPATPMYRARAGGSVTVSTPLWPHTRKLKPAIESRFPNRLVYVTLVEPPPAAPRGDWVVWFGEQTPGLPTSAPLMRPPSLLMMPSLLNAPRLSAAPKVYFAGKIGADGAVTSIVSLDSSDAAALQPWISALQQVRFSPALRNGTPVAVDVVIEIPVSPAARAER